MAFRQRWWQTARVDSNGSGESAVRTRLTFRSTFARTRRAPAFARSLGLCVTAALLVSGSGVAAPATSPELIPPFVEAARLGAFDGARAENFGSAVAVDANTVAVGARNASVNQGNQGAVYVYVRSGNTWTLQQKLVVPGGEAAANDHFGTSVTLAGDILLAGAPGVASNDGAVYAFTRSGATWTRTATIHAPGGNGSNEEFGTSVSLSGDTLAAGSPAYRPPAGSGAVYVFTRAGANWTQQGPRLTLSSPVSSDDFGVSVAVDGNRLLAGAPGRGTGGAAYVYTRSASTWTQVQALVAADPVKGTDKFGTAVTLDGNDLVVGAPGRASTSTPTWQVGAAYPFAFAAGIWVRSPALGSATSEERNDNQYGAAVSLRNGTLAVGAPRVPGQGSHQGLVYTYAGGQGAWTRRQTLTVKAAAGEAHLGASVATSGGVIVAGLPEDDFPAETQGSVTLYAELAAANDSYVTNQNTPLTVPAPGVLANDANPANVTLSAQLETGPAHGTLTLNSDGSFTYTPAAGFTGADGYSYRARQPDGTLSTSRP